MTLSRFSLSLLTLVLTALTAAPAAAQHTLGRCIRDGLQQNYSLRIVRGQEQTAANNATRANAGYLPTVTARGTYTGAVDQWRKSQTGTQPATTEHGMVDHSVQAGVFAEWTVFDGYKIQTNYQRLQELRRQSEIQTRIALEDYVGELATEYYNFVQQRLRLRNLTHAVALSAERLRIVQERWAIGNNSRLDLQQAQVDFNADSAKSLKQREMLSSSRIRLNALMANHDVDARIEAADTAITLCPTLRFDSLWAACLRTNTSLLQALSQRRLADIDLRTVRSRDYPYVRLSGSYAYAYSHSGSGQGTDRHTLGADVGVTVGMTLFDGNRRRERANALIAADNAEQARQNVMLNLRADLTDLWQAYQNNLALLALEEQNVVTARSNHAIACERFLLGDLSGIEMREAQQSLLDAEERILEAQYNTKVCEISLKVISGRVMEYMED
ncbi:MAG: TolC family protein [Bacteroidales bacterium]|nr:TolC family protein [Bacteroidales bacterium]